MYKMTLLTITKSSNERGPDRRLPALVADLVRLKVSVLVATDLPSSLAAAAATTTTPVYSDSGTLG